MREIKNFMKSKSSWRCGNPKECLTPAQRRCNDELCWCWGEKGGRSDVHISYTPDPEKDMRDWPYVVTATRNWITYTTTVWYDENGEWTINIEYDWEWNEEDIQRLTDILWKDYIRDEETWYTIYSSFAFVIMKPVMDCAIECGYNLDIRVNEETLKYWLDVWYDELVNKWLYYESGLVDVEVLNSPFTISYDWERECPVYIRRSDKYVVVDETYSLIDRDFFMFFGMMWDPEIECDCRPYEFFLPIEYYNKIIKADFKEYPPDEIKYWLYNNRIPIEHTTSLSVYNEPYYSTLTPGSLRVYSLNEDIVSITASPYSDTNFTLTAGVAWQTQIIIEYKWEVLYTLDFEVVSQEVIMETDYGSIVHNWADKTLTYTHTWGETPRQIVIYDRFVWSEWDGPSHSWWWWKTFQYWNNAMIRPRWWPETTEDQVDASTYWPWNYYYNEVQYVWPEDNWDSSNNQDLRWYVTGTEEARKWPCPDGFHIPTDDEFMTLISIINWINSNNTTTIANYSRMAPFWRLSVMYWGYPPQLNVMWTIGWLGWDWWLRSTLWYDQTSGTSKKGLYWIKPFKNTN